MREPGREADFLILCRLEDRDELQVGLAGILDDVALAPFHVANVAGAEIGGLAARTGVEHGHPAFTPDPVLPFVRVGVPVHFAHPAGLDRFDGGGDGFGHGKGAAVGKANDASSVFLQRFGGRELVSKGVRGKSCTGNGFLIPGERSRLLALKNPEVLQWNIAEHILLDAEILRQQFR